MNNKLSTTKALEGEYIAAGESGTEQDEVYGRAANEEMCRAQREHNMKVSLAAQALARGMQNSSQHYFASAAVGGLFQ
jgi:hypothetical protein